MSVQITYLYSCNFCDATVVQSDVVHAIGQPVRQVSIPDDGWRWFESKLICPRHKLWIGTQEDLAEEL